MATYVFSDVHGHHRTLERLLEQVSPADEDDIWILGDMVDRGPDPVSVMRTCRDLKGSHILLGNHEQMMLDVENDPHDAFAAISWHMNGGDSTHKGLEELSATERDELISWVRDLPLYAHINVNERDYLLVHAGLRPLSFSSHSRWNDVTMDHLLSYQVKDDLLWIREEFWGRRTGLMSYEGKGPIVIAGHTPVPYVQEYADVYDRPARDDDGQCQIMRLGAAPGTDQVADRWAIDCGAAGPAGWGRIAMIRLDDLKEYYEPVLEGD